MDIEEIIAFIIITLLGWGLNSLRVRIKSIPDVKDITKLQEELNEKIEDVNKTISGVKAWINTAKEQDNVMEKNQWGEINDLTKRLGQVEGKVEGIQIIIKKGD